MRLRLKNFVKHKDIEFTFKNGITAIKGKNGRGKSLIPEALRFALFGSQALRGKVSDYPKDMSVIFQFEVSGKKYEIYRTLTDCFFGSVIGTTACNKAISELFGYGLNVFDLGNFSKQGEISKLGRLKPTERKQAVDKVIGLDILDDLIKNVKEKVSDLKTRLSTLEEIIKEPKNPELKFVPEGLTKECLSQMLKEATEKESLLTELSKIEVKEIPQPKGDLLTASRKELLLKKLSNLHFIKDTIPYTLEELEEELVKETAWRRFGDHPKPELSEEEAEERREQLEEYSAWVSSKKAVCPDCGSVFSVTGVKKVEKPDFDVEYTLKQIDLVRLWKQAPDCPNPKITNCRNLISLKKELLEKNKAYIDTKEELERIGETGSEEEWRVYIQQKQINEKVKDLKERLAGLAIKDSSKDIQLWLTNAYYNETQQEAYNRELKFYLEKKEEIEKTKNEKIDHEKALEGLRHIKTKIKSGLTPRISEVASKLMRKMSNEDLKDIVVDEDFNILVDGRELNTFSGSEEALANLCLRIALGQVLTHKIFNVFIGDEIDADMDEDRARLVSEGLSRLSDQIEKIILISHRDISADNFIEI